MSGTNLYAGGVFTTAGGVSANRIAEWNGSTWSALSSGIGNFSAAIAVIGTDLYVAGAFDTAGGVPARNIAKWDGSAWSALGSGIDNSVAALAVSGTNLYAGGQFSAAGGVPAKFTAKWNGSAWSALGSGTLGPVNALAVSGSDLYAGGAISAAGNIAKWNGSTWSALGSGLSGASGSSGFGWVYAMAADASGHVFAGGGFSLAGTNPSPFIAEANVGSAPPVAPNQTFTRAPNLTLKIRIADVLAACSNPGGGTLAFHSVGASAQGATISTTATHILYSLAANANDSFPYTINDGQGGATTGTLNVQVVNPSGLAQGVSPSGGSVTVNFAGIPGYAYDIQRATDPGGPWATVARQTAPANGLFSYTDPSPPQPTAYYRLMHNAP